MISRAVHFYGLLPQSLTSYIEFPQKLLRLAKSPDPGPGVEEIKFIPNILKS